MLLAVKYKRRFSLDNMRLYVLPTLAVFSMLLVVTVLLWRVAVQSLQKENAQVATNEFARVDGDVVGRLKVYEEILRGGSALFQASDNVQRAEWKRFYDTIQLDQGVTGSLALGYIAKVPASQKTEFIQQARASGVSNYDISPNIKKSVYYPVLYIEPQNPTNNMALGYDMNSDAIRWEALAIASRTNQTVITGKISLIQDATSTSPQPAFLMVVPIYKKFLPIKSTAQKIAAIQGFAYAPFRFNELIASTFGKDTASLPGLTIYDGKDTIDQAKLVFKNKVFDELNAKNSLAYQSTVDLYGHSWTFALKVPKSMVPNATRNRPFSVLFTGIITSAFITSIILYALYSRAQALMRNKDMEVQEAKDELLSLASHQLRTPATSVKQYIGLLREGYAGKISRQQKTYLDKAHESNERQLKIVNEMLYVANADAGRLRMVKSSININTITKQAIEENSGAADMQNHKIIFKAHPTALMFSGDELFLQMAISNLISNAIKYTPPGGKIKVKIIGTRKLIKIMVSDNGVGMSPKDQGLIFHKFLRLDNEMASSANGSGVGLYLARKLVEMHKGRLDLESLLGEGSTFTITLHRRTSLVHIK